MYDARSIWELSPIHQLTIVHRLQKKEKQQKPLINEMSEQGLMEQLFSLWEAPVVLVRKKPEALGFVLLQKA